MTMTTTVRARGRHGYPYPPSSPTAGGRRNNLNRSRSGDGLKLLRKGKRNSGNASPGIASWIALFFLLVVLAVVIGTVFVQATLRTNPDALQNFSIRRRIDRNVDDYVDAGASAGEAVEAAQEEEVYDGEQYDNNDKENSPEQLQPASKDEGSNVNPLQQQREEEHRRREEELRRKEEELQKREEELKRAEEERQQKAAEEERQKAAELERQRRLEQEQAERRQREEEEKERQRIEAERLQKEQEERRQRQEEERRQREQAERLRLQQEEEERQRERERLEQEAKAEAERLRLEQEAQAKRQQEQDAQRQQHHARVAESIFKKEEEVLPEKYQQPKLSFCDFMRKKAGSFDQDVAATGHNGYANPAILILGMEDLSTDMVWHVLTQILFPHRPTTPKRTEQLVHHATAIDYSLLDKPSAKLQGEFWRKVSDKSRGKWLVHVFCQQQEHELAMGFPWMTHPADMIAMNHKAKDTLELIRTLPRGSVKIVRVKRNLLDATIRQAQRNAQDSAAPGAGQHQHVHAYHMKELVPVHLDHRKIFHNLHALQAEQDTIDEYLDNFQIPHYTVDFESIFPFGHWTELVQATQHAQDGGGNQPLNDFEQDNPQLATQMEHAWRDMLRYLDIIKPMTMFDVLQDAMRTHKVNTFWAQKDAVKNWGYIYNALLGTHYQDVLRKDTLLEEQQQEWGEGDEM